MLVLAAVRRTWRSPVYDHYNVYLERRLTLAGAPDRLLIRFECKFDPLHHTSQYRDRGGTSTGAQNLSNSANKCNERRSAPRPRSKDQFSETKHRALVIMMAAIQRMPPGSFVNPLYYEMVTLLRPGVKPFTEEGLTQDIENIYSTSLPAVARHLQVCPVEVT